MLDSADCESLRPSVPEVRNHVLLPSVSLLFEEVRALFPRESHPGLHDTQKLALGQWSHGFREMHPVLQDVATFVLVERADLWICSMTNLHPSRAVRSFVLWFRTLPGPAALVPVH